FPSRSEKPRRSFHMVCIRTGLSPPIQTRRIPLKPPRVTVSFYRLIMERTIAKMATVSQMPTIIM
ncbi:MAG: hypothetical protein LBD71_06785, partial [Treponema sp.]|nr:hypothetical protein [Treponema sp.]